MKSKKEDILLKLGKKIILLRESQGITQSDLARLCDKDCQNIYKIEQGKLNLTIKSLENLAKALNIEVYELLKF